MRFLRFPRRPFAVLAWMALLSAIQPLFADDPSADVNAIRSLLKAAFDKPDAPLEVQSIAVASTHAVAGWRQGPRGGRALLRKQVSGWTVVLCSGEPLTRASGLVEAGVPAGEAHDLASGVRAQDSKLDDDSRRLLSSFEGTVSMTDGPHAPHVIQDH